MTRTRLLGIGLLSVLAASLVLAAGASAGEYNLKMLPEIGRCKKVGGGGEFKGPRCIRSEPGVGNYSWFSGLGSKKGFTGTISEPIELNLKGGGPNSGTSCKSAELTGEYTGPKNLKIKTLVFHNCNSGEGECQNKAGSTNGEITAEELVGELGYISHPKRLKIGWDLKPASGSNLISFECGGANKTLGKSSGGGATREVQGSVIGKIEPHEKMAAQLGLIWELEKHGNQAAEKFEGGVKDTLSTILGEKSPGLGKATFASTFIGKGLLASEEAVEVLGRCVGAGC